MSDVHQNSLLLSVLSQFITLEFKANKRFGFKLNSMHHKLAVLAQPYPVNLTYEHEFVVGVEGPLSPLGIWSLKWQRPFWKATIKSLQT